ncbi:hypothetical protein GCM10009864_75480 [Streptomyces lunalinharesii]|uniref:Uncharacterized protein n=1 Tax=Streptomyces lunalinharesii TaxID=333384 RepID=A0ABN3T0E2_9ACTN
MPCEIAYPLLSRFARMDVSDTGCDAGCGCRHGPNASPRGGRCLSAEQATTVAPGGATRTADDLPAFRSVAR